MLCLQSRTEQRTVLFEDVYYCYETRMKGERLFMVLMCSSSFSRCILRGEKVEEVDIRGAVLLLLFLG